MNEGKEGKKEEASSGLPIFAPLLFAQAMIVWLEIAMEMQDLAVAVRVTQEQEMMIRVMILSVSLFL